MSDRIRIYDRNSEEYGTLKAFCEYLNRLTDRYYFHLKNTMFDIGQDWVYTAILTTDRTDSSSVTGTWQTCDAKNYIMVLDKKFKEAAMDIFRIGKPLRHCVCNYCAYDMSYIDTKILLES